MMLNKKLRVALLCLVTLVGIYMVPHWFISYITYPFIVIQSSIIDPIKRNYMHTKTDYELLRNQYDHLMRSYVQLQALQDHLADTQEISQFNKRYAHNKRVIAQIVERYFGNDEQYFLLDKGSVDAITSDMIVVYNDMLVGKVIQVFPWYSKCVLITDKRCKVAGYCANTKTCGVMQGNNASLLRFLHVSHLCQIKENDIVVSSGHGTLFPRGFGLGNITHVSKEGMTYHIMCEPLADFGMITHCSIIVE